MSTRAAITDPIDRLARRGVPILMYHRVTPDEMRDPRAPREVIDALRVSPEGFRSQMAWLSEAGFQTITLDDLLAADERPLPVRSVVLTFDDGYQDFADHAAPILVEFGFTAHLFLVADLVGKTSDWDAERFGIRIPMFDWDTARRLESQGFHCEAHTLTHERLAGLAADELRGQIAKSRERLRRELGRDVNHFAYPYGSFDEAAVRMVRESGYRSACTVQRGLATHRNDPFQLPRICVHDSDSLFDFKCSVLTGIPFRSGLLRRIRQIRSRLLKSR
jgi:peptidoglycan/xylan/chitin deacetylase (PgdA/CDA1 family)